MRQLAPFLVSQHVPLVPLQARIVVRQGPLVIRFRKEAPGREVLVEEAAVPPPLEAERLLKQVALKRLPRTPVWLRDGTYRRRSQRC